ncbi:MAG: tetratricopeptide repeat protein [Alphaproteobacteria bacterium]|nr:tetratricopeptide repeat protein [Alphaproteobacteria bacterium]
MADIFDEVDEDLKQDNAKKIWDRYGRYMVGVAALVILATAGHVGWREYVQDRQEAYSARFMSALSLSNDAKHREAAAVLADLSRDAGSGYGVLAQFREAVERVAAGENAAAIDIYDAVADDSGVDTLYRELAVLNSVLLQIDSGDVEKLKTRIAPLLATENPWRHSATEIVAVLAMQTGQLDEARKSYQQLADDLDAPQGVRSRATEMLRTFGK